MKDLKSPRLMWLKAILLVLIGALSGTLLFVQAPHWQTLVLLGLCVWGFCRAYYFAFYVIEHYIDPSFKFSGLGSVLRHVLKRRK